MTTATATIAHQLPGRVRLRLPRAQRGVSLMERVRAALDALAGVRRVVTDTLTGSILIEHDRQGISLHDIATALRGAEVVLETGAEAADAVEHAVTAPPAPPVAVAQTVAETVRGANRQVRTLSAGLFDLRLLAPLALATIGIVQWRRSGTGILPPPSTALWYAFSLFMTFNVK